MEQINLNPEDRADIPAQDAERDDGTMQIATDLAYKRLAIVNLMFYGVPHCGDGGWTLIDAGLPHTAGAIISAADERFGEGARPAAIVLTHAHFDHVSALEELAERWQVPIYAHELEVPYLTGKAAYPPPDSGVGGGIMPMLSPLFPRSPIDVSRYLQVLSADGSVPTMPGWKWLHTPGHTPGHVSFWRETDRSLIVGDAFITTKQESAYAVAVQKPELHGPPMYFTQNFEQAKSSVEKLAALEPELAVTGHGRAMQGAHLREALHQLARDFESVAVPDHGKYVLHPTDAQSGTAYDSV